MADASVSDNAVLATIVTAFLVREGGQVTFTSDEWDQAIEHDGSLYVHRQTEHDPMFVVLMQKVEAVS
jgi:hypothetical protein